MSDLKELLTSCDKEPIHVPGRIQSHGYLFAFNKQSGLLTTFSENAAQLLPNKNPATISYKEVLAGNRFTLPEQSAQAIHKLFSEDQNKNQVSSEIRLNDETWFMIGHECEKNVIIELEACKTVHNKRLENIIEDLISNLIPHEDYLTTLQKITEVIHEISGYERVMIYRFLEDGTGEVLTEIKHQNDSPYLGQHFPASDIPKQARELYKKNLIRIISDVNNNNVQLVSVGHNQSLDLTDAVLRAVSPVHIEYLKNMGVAASFSVSIIVQGELWGLITCHHSQPKFLDYREREVLKLIGKILSSNLELKKSEESSKKVKQSNEIISKAFQELLLEPEIEYGLEKILPLLTELISSNGAAILHNDKIVTTGSTPTHQQINSICNWLKEKGITDVYHTDQLSIENQFFEPIRQIASGLMVTEIRMEKNCNAILWFRPEVVETIQWAGKPEKIESIDVNGLPVISPRRSFAQWAEIVRNKSKNWSHADISSAVKLRADVEKIMALKKNESEVLEQFKESYAKMESFGFTISHDLKTPLSAVTSYTDILLEDGENLTDFQITILERISAGAKKMSDLINGAIYYSRMEKQVISRSQLNMHEILNDIKEEMLVVYNEHLPQIRIVNPVDLNGDRNMIVRLFTNLIANAVKFSTDKETPVVIVTGLQENGETIYTVEDNGIGIPEEAGDKIFDSFTRHENAWGFEGTGIGLGTVKQIILKHNGTISYTSKTGEGTIFTLRFPD